MSSISSDSSSVPGNSTPLVPADVFANPQLIEAISDGVKELCANFAKIEVIKDTNNSIIDSLHDATKIPKAILRKVAEMFHRQNASEIKEKNNVIDTLYRAVRLK